MKEAGEYSGFAVSGAATPPPPGWGHDELTRFLGQAELNRYATYVHKRAEVERLIAIDQCFMTVTKDWINPKGIVPANLLFRAHSAYRAAVGAAMAGQVAEMFPLTRSALEYAAYALCIQHTPGSAELWLRRHDDEASRKAVVRAFSQSALRDAIARKNRKAAEVFVLLYERTIDFGAHPNERALTGNLSMTSEEDRASFMQIYLHGDGLALDHALKTLAESGICSLEILQEVFPARFELLGVRVEILRLRQGV